MEAPDIKEVFPNEKVEVDFYLTVLAFFVLLGAVAYTIWLGFSFYWDVLHSDIVGDLLFVREAVYQRSLFPYGWPHLQEMRFMHLTTVIIPFYVITGDLNLSYPLAVSFMLVVNIGLFYYMLSYRKRPLLPIIMGFSVLLMVFARYAMFSVFSILFINGSLVVALSTVFITIGAYMRLKHNTGHKRVSLFLLWGVSPALALMQGVQSTRLLIVLYIPLLIVECYPLVLEVLRERNIRTKMVERTTVFTIVCAVCNLMGIALITVLIRREIIINNFTLVTTNLRISGYHERWDLFFETVRQLFLSLGLQGNVGVYSLYGFVFFGRVVLIVALIIILRKTFARLNHDKSILNFFIASVVSLSVAMVFTITGVGERFLFTIVVLFGVMTVMVLEYFMRHKRHVLMTIVCVFIFLLVGASARTITINRNEDLHADRQMIAQFIIDHGLTIGYGGFWESVLLTAVGDFQFDVIPLDTNHLRTNPSGVTMERYHHDEQRVFVVLPWWQENTIMANDQHRAIFETGTRHEIQRGWMVYIFEHNPFRY